MTDYFIFTQVSDSFYHLMYWTRVIRFIRNKHVAFIKMSFINAVSRQQYRCRDENFVFCGIFIYILA